MTIVIVSAPFEADLYKKDIMIANLTDTEIEKLLETAIIGRLGCYADGLTYVVPISYAYDGTWIYGHTGEGMKLDMMRKNPQVCFQVDSMPDMANWKSVIAWGEFEELTDYEQRSHAIRILMNRVLPLVSSETTHLSPQWPFPADEPAGIPGIAFRIRLQKKTGRFEKAGLEANVFQG
jgi:nitroimidazol reductase NimA-like FMN-containing flavoprotein (pyridoxamine 5'-phosphate oxidase superfamily)